MHLYYIARTVISVIISDEAKQNAKEFSKVYLYTDNTLDYEECEAGLMMMSVIEFIFLMTINSKFDNSGEKA